MSPKPLVGGKAPGVAEDWLERMENCFREFQCTEEQKMETLGFLLEVNDRKWWRSTYGPFIAARGVVTWAEFWTDFERLYFPPALRQSKASELLSLRQRTMTVDEYQKKFFELLPYCPQFASSSEENYDLFLHGLNPEIHQLVAVGSDMTYEGLVSHCHQEEDSLRRNRSMVSSSSRPASSLGPRSQSFNKQGDRDSRGSQESVQQQQPQYQQQCQQSQHSQRQHSQNSSHGHYSLRPRVQGQVFSLNQEQAEADSDRMIAGTYSLCGFPAYVLIDIGASHSFISVHFSITVYPFRRLASGIDSDG
ncbi:uncharacterized protein [Henckelia pumila]|uniref:uncharacterized protein n=1 Tax=Henckelia pumila TaxID=405737 RepID=UPI003C6E7854